MLSLKSINVVFIEVVKHRTRWRYFGTTVASFGFHGAGLHKIKFAIFVSAAAFFLA